MPSGVYTRTEKHSYNIGRKHPNRKKPVTGGLKPINKVCLHCNKDFVTNCLQPRKKFCSQSCGSKSNLEINLINLNKRDKEKQRIAVSSRVGEKHQRWIKDRRLVKLDKERGGTLHKQWSKSVKKRDNYKCLINNTDCCGRLESHHILSWKDHIDLRYELSNGVTLCHLHHPRKREDELRLIPLLKGLLNLI